MALDIDFSYLLYTLRILCSHLTGEQDECEGHVIVSLFSQMLEYPYE